MNSNLQSKLARTALVVAVAAMAGFVALHFRPTPGPTATVLADASPEQRATPPRESISVSRQTEAGRSEVQPPAAPLPSPPAAKPDEITLQLTLEIEQAMNSTNDADRDLVFTNLLPALVARDPAAAGRLAEQLEPGDGRAEFLRRVAQAWSAASSAGAIAWAANLADAGERKSTLTDACLQIAQANPAEAIATAERFDLGGSNATLENLAQLWAGQDLTAALDWARKLPAGESRDQVLARVAFAQAQIDPLAAAGLIVNEMAAGPVQTEAAISVLHQWALRDLPAATAWVDQFPDGPLRDRARSELAGVAQYFEAAQPSR